MKVGIFLENFTETELMKDPGLIADGLLKSGLDIKIFSHSFSPEVTKKFEVHFLSKSQRNQRTYWENSDIETLIIYSWLSLRYSKLITAAGSAGVKVILKLDSDGNLFYPLTPSYLRVFGLNSKFSSKFIHLLRLCQWKLFPRLLSRKKINQIQRCDAVIIETPIAKENLCRSLSFWRQEQLIKKINVIPNPIIDWPTNISNKRNIITAIGRWDDMRKNPSSLVEVLSSLKSNWQIELVGKDSLKIEKLIRETNDSSFIVTNEKLEHKKVFLKLSESKIIFAPSIAESFNLAVAEAMCCGCSLVGGKLPSFDYFSRDGFSGSISPDFKTKSLTKTLENDIKKWERGEYQASTIAAHWQEELGLKKVSTQIVELIKSL